MSRAVLLVPILGIFWGLNWPAVRICLGEIPPWTLRAVGFSVGAVLLFGLIVARGGSVRVPRRDWLRLAAVGILSVTAYNVFSAFAQLTASTSRSAVLSYTMPIWAVVLAWLFLGERLDSRRRAGLALGVAGLFALGWPLVVGGQLTIGLLFALMSGIVWAGGSTVLKRFPIDAPPLVITAWQLALGALTTGTIMLAVEGVPHPHPLLPATAIALLFHVVCAQAAATAIWFTILHALPLGVASIGSLLVPAIGVIGATILLGERPTAADWTGLVLVVAASATVLLRFEPARPAAAR